MTIKLKDIYFFQGIDKNAIAKIIDNSKREKIDKDIIIIKQAEESDNFAYIIQEGTVIVSINGDFITELKEGDVFGEIALITNEKRTATIKSKTDVILLKINKKLLTGIIKDFPNGAEIQKEIFKRIKENFKK